jgi:hypothetical protein
MLVALVQERVRRAGVLRVVVLRRVRVHFRLRDSLRPVRRRRERRGEDAVRAVVRRLPPRGRAPAGTGLQFRWFLRRRRDIKKTRNIMLVLHASASLTHRNLRLVRGLISVPRISTDELLHDAFFI